MFYAKINAVHFAATTATAKEALWGVQLTASEFQLAYLPSSVLSGSSAAMQLSSSSKTDRHSQPFSFFSSKLLLPCHLVKWMVKYHGVAEACSVGWWTQDSLRDREPQTQTQILPTTISPVWSQLKLPYERSPTAITRTQKRLNSAVSFLLLWGNHPDLWAGERNISWEMEQESHI